MPPNTREALVDPEALLALTGNSILTDTEIRGILAITTNGSVPNEKSVQAHIRSLLLVPAIKAQVNGYQLAVRARLTASISLAREIAILQRQLHALETEAATFLGMPDNGLAIIRQLTEDITPELDRTITHLEILVANGQEHANAQLIRLRQSRSWYQQNPTEVAYWIGRQEDIATMQQRLVRLLDTERQLVALQ